MAKTTYEEKQARKRAERDARIAETDAKRLAEWRTSFRKRQARRVYTETLAWVAHDAGDDTGVALYEMVHEIGRLRENLRGKIESAQRSLSEAVVRLDAGNRPSWYSNGILGSTGHDIDQLSFELDATAKATARMAWVGGWRVRELEAADDRAHQDFVDTLRVEAETDGKWRVKAGADYAMVPGTTELLPGFDDEDAAWRAVHVLVEGRAL